jgi:hypothetical protein
VTRASDKSTTDPRAGGTAAINKPLPLTSPNWWPLDRTLSYVYAQTGHSKIADFGFLQAVNRNRVRVKLEQLDLRTKPPTLKSFLLPPGKYELEAHINNTWMFRQRDDGRRYLQAPYAMFLWAPDVKKIWPSDAPEGSLDLTHHQKSERRITPQVWFKQALVDIPRFQHEAPGAYAKRLHKAMEADSDRLTRVYALDGVRRALNRK